MAEPTKIEAPKPVQTSAVSNSTTPPSQSNAAPSKPTAPQPSSKLTPPSPKPMPTELKGKDFSLDIDLDDGTKVGPQAQLPPPSQTQQAPTTQQASTQQQPPITPQSQNQPQLGEQVKPFGGRDYTGFTEEEQRHLKAMSNEAFNFTAKLRKELEKLKNSTYLQHSEAYLLDPQYKKATEDIQYLSAEAQLWKNELVNIKTGKEWRELKGWDKQGNPVYGPKQAPSEIAEEDVRQRMLQCQQSVQQMQGNLQQLQQGYTSRIQQDIASINQAQAQKFGWVNDTKQLESTVNIPNLGERSIKQIKEDFSSLIPMYLRGHILADVASNMFAALQIYASEISNLRSQLQVAETKRQDANRVEPTSTQQPRQQNGAGKGKYGIETFDLSGLPT